MPTCRITSTLVDSLAPGTSAWDAEVRGFGVRRQARDSVYVLKTRIAGRQRFFTIGRHQPGVMTPDRARREATRLLGLIRDGQDPAAERDAEKAMLTVADLCDAYMAAVPTLLLRRAGRAKKESTLISDRGRIAGHIKPLLGDLPVNQVSQTDIEAFLHKVAAGATAAVSKTRPRGVSRIRGGRGVASRTVGLLGAIFAYAVKRGIRVDNPVRGVVRFADVKRERRLTDDEYLALGRGLAQAEAEGVSPVGLAALRLLILTGWRKTEATALRWSELDISGRTARLGDTKSGVSVRPLSPAVIDLIKRQIRCSKFVFPARISGKSLQGLPRMWERVRQLSGLQHDVTIHVMRHSFASVAADLGFGDATIAGLIGHKRAGITSRYTHAADAVLVAAADSVAKSISARMTESRA